MAALRSTEERVSRRSHRRLLVFTTEPTEPGVTAYSRMFAAGLGIAEDPATGSACGPLGCYLVHARAREGRRERHAW